MTIMTQTKKQPMNGAQAKRLIALERSAEMVVGHKWYLLDNNWWVNFAENADQAKDNELVKIPPINNSALVTKKEDGGYELKPNLQLQIHIIVLPEALFSRLKESYGVENEERDEITREVILGTLMQQQPFIEIYPLIIKVAEYSRKDQICTVSISQGDPISKIREAIMDVLNVRDAEKRREALFFIEENGQFELLPSSISHTKLSALLNSGSTVYVDTTGAKLQQHQKEQKQQQEAKNQQQDSVAGLDSNGPATRAGTRYSNFSQLSTQYPRGLCGLQNLGNTCFMNSALQCMSNVPELTEYFLRGEHTNEINEKNPLGTQGRLVNEYSELLKELWSGQHCAVRPFKLKCVIGEFAPRFNGYAQQDSQELTAFLLDGLHEDLNRIKRKPYIEEKEVDGRDESEAANEAWQDYKKRNDSIVVDLLHGQLKSTLTCNVCNKVSVKFDPFCFLSVPIPAKERQAKSVVVFVRKEKWAKFSVTHTNKTTARQIKQMLREHLQLPTDTQIVLLTYYAGDIVEDDSTLVPPYPSYSNKWFYAYAVGLGPIMLVENRLISLSLQTLCPMLPANQPAHLTRRAILSEVLPHVRELCWRGAGASLLPSASSSSNSSLKEASLTQSAKTQSSEAKVQQQQVSADQINGNDQPMEEEDDELLTVGPVPTDMVLNQISAKADEAFPQNLDEEPPYLKDGPIIKVILKWEDPVKEFFHTVDVNNLVDREVNMTTALKKHYSLKECIDLYTMREQLSEEDLWYCPRCKKHQQAFKKLDLWSLPKILVIHLKRFIYSRYTRDKIDTEIEIPIRGLDLSDKILNPLHKQEKYDLIGISNHMGGLGSGHYTAYALNGDQWCEFNDSNASRIGRQFPDVFSSREAYMLVYRRRKE